MNKIIFTILLLIVSSTNIFAETCITNNKTLHYEVFYNKSEALQYARDRALLDNIIHDQTDNRYLVFNQLPETVFVCSDYQGK